MRYCISDIHGHFTEFKELLNKINFKSSDRLYILGDLCDRGTENIEVLNYVMKHKDNIICLMGNHDIYLRDWLSKEMDSCSDWVGRNGGETTQSQIKRLSEERKSEILEFLRGLEYYKIIDNNIVLVHAGILPRGVTASNIETLMSLMDKEDMVWARPCENWLGYNRAPVGTKFIVGHTPVSAINGNDEILVRGNTTFIDCGIAYNRKLGCYCIDTGDTWYVEKQN